MLKNVCYWNSKTRPTSTFKICFKKCVQLELKTQICKHYQMLKMNILQAKVWATNTMLVCNFKMSLELVLGT